MGDNFHVNDQGQLDLGIPVAAAARPAARPRSAECAPMPPTSGPGEAWTEADFERHGFKQCDPADLNQDDYVLDPDPDFEPVPEDWPGPNPETDPDDEAVFVAGMPPQVRGD